MKNINPRIIAGKYKNKKLEVPESARPITDRVKQVLFDSINDLLQDSNCLDLFAGSGSIGIEALSRGAKFCTFVEKDKNAYQLLRKNLITIHDNEFDLFNEDYIKFVKSFDEEIENKYDIIFLDPPFPITTKVKYNSIFEGLKEEGIAILRIDLKNREELKLPETAEIKLEKKVGRSVLLFLTQ